MCPHPLQDGEGQGRSPLGGREGQVDWLGLAEADFLPLLVG